MVRVIKRDGGISVFDSERIVNAIMKAQEEVGMSNHNIARNVSDIVAAEVFDRDNIHIDEIQIVVERELMRHQPKVGIAYTKYRMQRDKAREDRSALARGLMGLLDGTNKEVTLENANKSAKVFPVKRDLMAGLVSKHFAKNLIPSHIYNAHESGDIHFHDLDYSPFLPYTNCCLVDLKSLLGNGFKLGNAQLESPKSIGVACAVLAQITSQVASHQFGGTSFANVDQVLAPYAKLSWDKWYKIGEEYGVNDVEKFAYARTAKEIYDGIQAIDYEINTMFTTNGQFPFVTLTFGMGTNWFEREIQKAILNIRIKGMGKDGITPVFPKLVMFLEEGINLKPEDPNYDIKKLALECSAKRMYPDIISAKNNRLITGSSVPVSPMGCRSFLSVWHDENGKEVLDGRNNLGVVSVNLPRIALESRGNFDLFWKILDQRLDLCKEALDYRISTLRGVKAEIAPIMYTEGAFGVRLNPQDEIFDLFKHGRSSISLGYIGLHEVMHLMFPGKHPFLNDEAKAFSLNVLDKMKSTVMKWKRESEDGWGYSLYSTPSESLCDRFCKLDKKRFGDVWGVTDKGWYTNSFHLEVEHKVSPFDKIDFEAKYHGIASGGHISFAEFPEMRHNLEALETVWDYAMEKLAYFATNLPSDNCYECGFSGEFDCTSRGFSCPSCGNKNSLKMNVVRRVCGYLGNPAERGFNDGKQAEMEQRVKHL